MPSWLFTACDFCEYDGRPDLHSTVNSGYLAKRKARVNLAKKFENSDKFDKLENFRSRNRIRGRLLSNVVAHRRGTLFHVVKCIAQASF